MQENTLTATKQAIPEAMLKTGPELAFSVSQDSHNSEEENIKQVEEQPVVVGKRMEDRTFPVPVREKAQKTWSDDSKSEERSTKSRKSEGSGRWTKEEHKRFMEALRKFGKNWKKVEAYVGTRSGTQVRSHAQKYFLKTEGKQHKDTSKSITPDFDSESAAPTVITGISPEKNETDMNAGQKKALNNVVIPPPQPKETPIKAVLLKIEQLENSVTSAWNRLKAVMEGSGDLRKQLLSLQQEFFEISQVAFNIVRQLKDDPENARKCMQIIEAANFGLTEIDRGLQSVAKPVVRMSNGVESKFLQQYMKKFGFESLEEIESRYTKLSDWVDTSSKMKQETNIESGGRVGVNSDLAASLRRFNVVGNL